MRHTFDRALQELNADITLASTLDEKDDEVDHLYAQVFRELLEVMTETPTTINQAIHLLFVGRYLKRIADHAINISERVIYMVTGEHPNQI